MMIIGCDYHPSMQQIAWTDKETGECGERQLRHSDGEAERFYRELKQRSLAVRVGIEATGHTRWFERLLAELGFELWVGNAAEIRARKIRRQRYDREDARHLLRLMLEERFPRLWVPNAENRDLRQLLLHRHRLVQMRARVKNQLQAIALNEGIQRQHRLWSQAGRAQLESLRLPAWLGRRRDDLLRLLDQFTLQIGELSQAIEREAEKRPEVQHLRTHPGVGPITALAFVLVLGRPDRFRCGKQVGSYLGLIPAEESSGGKQRLGHISKQGNTLLRFLLVEAAQSAVRTNPEWRKRFLHLAMRRSSQIAKVALARKLAVSLYWQWRNDSRRPETADSARTRNRPGNDMVCGLAPRI